MELSFLLLLVIFSIIVYLIYVIYIKKDKKKHVKKVRFYGIPTEIDSIKPKFKTEPINDTNINNVITPMNNLEKLSENSVDF